MKTLAYWTIALTMFTTGAIAHAEVSTTKSSLIEQHEVDAPKITQAASLPSKKISVDIKKAGARSALTALLENSGIKFMLAEEITNDVKVNVEAKKTKWSEVFAKILSQAKLTYHVGEDGTIEVTPAIAVAPAPTAAVAAPIENDVLEETPTTNEDAIE